MAIFDAHDLADQIGEFVAVHLTTPSKAVVIRSTKVVAK
jgi:hypothetical protein